MLTDELALYEGLIFRHSTRLESVVEDDLDDIRQFYRVKAWRALESFDQARFPAFTCRRPCSDGERCPRCRYVFMCLKNGEKDLLKKRRINHSFIEDHMPTVTAADGDGQKRGHGFEDRYLSTDAELVYACVEDTRPLLPNTLTRVEVRVVVLLYRDYRQSEVASEMGMAKGEVQRTIRSIKTKMADWRPGAGPAPAPGDAKVEFPVAA